MKLKKNKIGILGGGQLARMLAMEGHKLGFEMHVMSQAYDDPAALVCARHHQGDINNVSHIETFLSQVDFLTFESEFLSDEAFESPRLKATKGVLPQLSHLQIFSDRLTQKKWLNENKIPTSPHIAPQNAKDLEDFYSGKKSIVLKKRRFGYDGYGTIIIKSKKELSEFIKNHGSRIPQFIAEDFCAFQSELALQFSVTTKGDVLTFPLVEWMAENSKCLWVKGPIDSTDCSELIKTITQALKKMKYVGTVAFELFKTENLYQINEVAPRVHNSGHHTLESCFPNQFSAHLLAITGHSLPEKPYLHTPGFAMYNLIGSHMKSAKLFHASDVALHWYCKNENRPGRKMGHLTALDKTSDLALKQLQKVRKGFDL